MTATGTARPTAALGPSLQASGIQARAARSWLTATGYALAAAALGTGWMLRTDNLIDAGHGVGYWLGIAGASLMGLLLLYPLRKRSRLMARLGPVSAWFRIHMLFGVLGPLLIILHSNFRLGSFNGRVALFSTLVVAGSGIIGRYIYAKIHHGLYGRRATLAGLGADVQAYHEQTHGPLNLMAELLESLTAYENRHLESGTGVLGSFVRALLVVPETALLRWRLLRAARRKLAAEATASAVMRKEQSRLQRAMRRYVGRRIQALRKFAQFRAFESLFGLWHVVHYPLFVVMVVAVVVHVLAVHMY